MFRLVIFDGEGWYKERRRNSQSSVARKVPQEKMSNWEYQWAEIPDTVWINDRAECFEKFDAVQEA